VSEQEFEEQRVRVTDKRRVDPVTNEVRQPIDPAGAPGLEHALLVEEVEAELFEGEVGAVELKLAELTSDLQRVHAEYANYRKRVERDREMIRQTAVGGVLAELLSLLDDIERARQHGELEGGFKSVGEALEATLARLGLESFGSAGDGFDPNVHEALTSESSDGVSEPTVIAVYQPGYRYADRVLRPARVAVAGTD
jgi:molecular chaperone GrpE